MSFSHASGSKIGIMGDRVGDDVGDEVVGAALGARVGAVVVGERLGD